MDPQGTLIESARRETTWFVRFAVLQEAIQQTKQDGQTRHFYSPPFDSNRWKLKLVISPRTEGPEADHCGVFLCPATPRKVPVQMSVTIYFQTSPGGRSTIAPALIYPLLPWGMVKDGEGAVNALPFNIIDAQNPAVSLVTTVRLEEGPVRTPAMIPYALLDSPELCDVAFTFPHTPSPLFALKAVLLQQSAHFRSVFESGFAEGVEDQVLPPPPTPEKMDLEALYIGDPDEFAEFEPRAEDVPDAGFDGPIAAKREGEDAKEGSTATTDEGPSTPTAPAPETNAAPTASLSSDSAPPDAAEGRTLSTTPQKKYHKIAINDCSWATLHSLLFALYYDDVAFFQSRAHVIAILDHHVATHTPGFKAPRQTELLARSAASRSDPPPLCSAHAFYRLADRYLELRLRDRARLAILQNLRIETAAYEAFSSLSRTFPEVCDGVVAFILEHADDVFASRGWARVLELVDEGALAGGATVMNRILAAVREKAAREAREAKAEEEARRKRDAMQEDSDSE